MDRLDADGGLGPVNVNPAHTAKDADTLSNLSACVVIDLSAGDRIAGESYIKNRLIVRIRLGEGRR